MAPEIKVRDLVGLAFVSESLVEDGFGMIVACALRRIGRGKTVRLRKPSGPNLLYSKS